MLHPAARLASYVAGLSSQLLRRIAAPRLVKLAVESHLFASALPLPPHCLLTFPPMPFQARTSPPHPFGSCYPGIPPRPRSLGSPVQVLSFLGAKLKPPRAPFLLPRSCPSRFGHWVTRSWQRAWPSLQSIPRAAPSPRVSKNESLPPYKILASPLTYCRLEREERRRDRRAQNTRPFRVKILQDSV